METTIAYKQPQNLQDLLKTSKLCEGKGWGVYAFLQVTENPKDFKPAKTQKPLKYISLFFSYFLYV